MRHLVLGGAGFIGANLASRLLEQGEPVVVLDDLSRRGADLNIAWLREHHPTLRFVRADIRRDLSIMDDLVAEADAVYHLAAQVAVTSSVDDPRRDFEINLLGTLNVLEAIRRTEHRPVLIYSSTNKVYGQMESLPIDVQETRYTYAGGRVGVSEEQPLDFHSPYACSKGGADQYVRDYARVYGMPTVVLRQSCIYGPRQFGIEDQGWLAWFAISAMLGRPVTIYGTGKQVRDVLHVSDLIDLIEKAVAEIDIAKGQVYNVGGGPAYSLSLLEALELLEQYLGAPIPHSFAPTRPGDQRIYVSDITKASEELKWRPRIAPATGVEELVSWVTASRELFSSY
ncbi:MAG: GDP-mannose 4,6-dehydratase [Gaiellaceae bacterium]